MKKIKKTLGSLTAKQVEMYEGFEDGVSACTTIMEEIAIRLERINAAKRKLWQKIYEEYKDQISEKDWCNVKIDNRTNKIYIVTDEYREFESSGQLGLKKLGVAWEQAKREE